MATRLNTESFTDEELPSELSFTQLLHTLSGQKRIILWTVLVSAIASAAIAFLIPAEYTSEAVILTPQKAEPSLSEMAQLAGAGPGVAGLSLLSGFGLRNPSDLYVGILKSRTIADALIARFHLKQVYNDKYLQQARKHLARRTTIKAGKDTLIHIEVDDGDPKRAAGIANAYVAELSNRNSTVALTEASQRRLFFEGQVAKEKQLLAAAEVALRDTEQVTGLVVPTGQAEALVRSAAQLKAEILGREAQLAGLRTYVTDDNPRLQMVERELAALRSELANMERGEHIEGTPEVPVGKLPQAGLEYLRKYRDVKYHESLYEALAKQYEAARLDEAKASPMIQVIDNAVIPEKKSWPPRLLIILISCALAALGSSLWIVANSQNTPQANT
ncbi:MAG TPA: Wzz/FepE/Etk N-terminal domain-containing protein [Bryobacteraceae bacterium]|nr:Wzz/FepE/Etk N-terminal domain-containing protein [Bryobacteraceae bacterium]